MWDRSAEEWLSGPLGVTPLALLGAIPPGVGLTQSLTGVVQRLIERLERDADPGTRKLLLTAAFVLSGLRLRDMELGRQVFAGVRAMRESVTYMGIIDEGQEIALRKLIRRQVTR